MNDATVVKARFELSKEFKDELQSMVPNFGFNGFGETVFYTRYSRLKKNGGRENWADVVIRCIEGCISIRKDWYYKSNLVFNEQYWTKMAEAMAVTMFRFKWVPPGRGLWAMGTDFIYERGSMALQNCGYTDIGSDIGTDCRWAMDALMCGVGIGFGPLRDDKLKLSEPVGKFEYIIPDTREGWANSVKVLIDAFVYGAPLPVFNYSYIRPEGVPIKGFGGVASGPAPLMSLHGNICLYMRKYMNKEPRYDSVRLKTDIMNDIGCAVVAGNVRRSAEIACGDIDDPTFLDLKNYKLNPDRMTIGWMSNNSAKLYRQDHYTMLNAIAKRVALNGEPGLLNMLNIPYGRIGKNDNLRPDKAVGVNPCGEQPLEDKELCCLVETLPTKCANFNEWKLALQHATIYAQTVTLLPTHSPETNAVMMRNRRIGVGIMDYTGLVHRYGQSSVTRWLRDGYAVVRETAKQFSNEAGVPEPIRVTTVKPGGTTPKLAGVTAGSGYPNFRYTLRRLRLAKNSDFTKLLLESGMPYEQDVVSSNTLIFKFPIVQGPAKPADKVSLWQQAINMVTLQAEWSDNAVSNTLNFKPKWPIIGRYTYKTDVERQAILTVLNHQIKIDFIAGLNSSDEYEFNGYKAIENKSPYENEILICKYDENHEEDIIEDVLSFAIPRCKSLSLLPHSSKGVYKQSPEEGLTEEEYNMLLDTMPIIDWDNLGTNDDVTDGDKYCSGPTCEITQ